MEATGTNTSQLNAEDASANLPSSLTISNLSVVVLMGLPACGKSTLANKLSQLSSNWRAIIISFDDYVPLNIQAKISQNHPSGAASPDEFNETPHLEMSHAKILRKKFVYCVDAVCRFANELGISNECQSINFDSFLSSLSSLLCSYESTGLVSNESFLSKVEQAMKAISDIYAKNEFKIIILVDDNNYYHSMRNDFYQVAKQLEVGFCMIYCKSSLKTCVQRNSQRPLELRVPHKVIVEMALKFEDPNPLQNACDMYCVEIDLNGQDINLLLLEDVISNSMCNPLKKNDDRAEEIERERRICSENEVHQADLVLRKWINKKLNLTSLSNSLGSSQVKCDSSGNGNLKKKLSKELNAKKKMALEKLRSGELKVSSQVEQDIEFQGEIVKLFENMILE